MTHAGSNLKHEDTLQCFFFSTTELSKVEWEQLCESINGTIKSISKDYIWHRDQFRIVLPIFTEIINDIPSYLTSITCFGDNIEDEWYIVYLILELTKLYSNLIVKVNDNDGDFLLIEAADYLPAWANPETTENRVFLFNQHVHLIPYTVASMDSYLKLVDAIELVTQNPEETRVSLEIEQALLKRIGDYPQKFKDGCHKAVLTLPVEIATILTLEPSLIAPIVNMYCSLDVLDAKYCKNIKFEECVSAEVIFTKYLYAMLIQSKVPSYVKCNIIKKEKSTQLGLKVTCAYRTIMNRLSKGSCSTPEYKKFLDSLIRNGYFKDNLEGSREYSSLLEKAKTYFFDMECPVSLYACNIINKLKSSTEFDNTSKLLKSKSDNCNLYGDDDNWLNVNPDELNEFLNNCYGQNVKLKNNDPITPHILTSELTDFLKETSDFEGIEQYMNENTEQNAIDFDAENFVNCLKKILNLDANQNDVDIDYSSDDDNNSVESNRDLTLKTQELELASKLNSFGTGIVEHDILKNLSQSMKEGITGPATTILRQIGLKKSDILDSDDDED